MTTSIGTEPMRIVRKCRLIYSLKNYSQNLLNQLIRESWNSEMVLFLAVVFLFNIFTAAGFGA